MTDVAATPTGGIDKTAVLDSGQALVWQPAAPAKPRRTALWIGIGVGALLVLGAAGALSTVLIAPGTTIAGIPVGGLTPGAAAEKVSSTIAGTEITLTGTGTAATVTGADLGVSVDAQLLAQEAHAAHPFWDFGSWNPEPSPVALTLDPETAESKLRSAVPAAWEAPVDATVVFDADENTFVMTPATSGTGIDIDALTAAIGDALAAGETEVTFAEGPIAYAPDITDEAATEALETANAMIRKSGFYVGKERVVSLKRATVAGWFDFVAEDGALRLEPDLAAIQATVDIVPDKANAEPVAGKEIVNSSGTVLRAVEEGKAGREVIGVENIAEGVAEQIRLGSATYQLEVKEVPFASTQVVRKLSVNLSTQRMSMIEDGKVVDSWAISSGASGTPTHTGNYTINWKTPLQNMRGYERRGGERFKDPNWSGPTDSQGYAMFEQPNVRWAMYFNGNQAFHGVYWHSNWGNRMSHGCVGMPEWRAQQLYEWTPQGVEVSIHY